MTAIPFVLPVDTEKVIWTRDEFLDYVSNADFGDRRFELLWGVMFEKMGDNKRHRFGGFLTMEALRKVFGDGYFVATNVRLPLSERDVPEPDVVVYGGSLRELSSGTISEAAVRLLVEVVDSRLDTALHKRSVYALAGVPEYWIVNVNRLTVTVHRDPLNGAYRDVKEFFEGSIPVENALIRVQDILPPATLAD